MIRLTLALACTLSPLHAQRPYDNAAQAYLKKINYQHFGPKRKLYLTTFFKERQNAFAKILASKTPAEELQLEIEQLELAKHYCLKTKDEKRPRGQLTCNEQLVSDITTAMFYYSSTVLQLPKQDPLLPSIGVNKQQLARVLNSEHLSDLILIAM